jgi:2-hydroxycyclohexanecarboxyl-CoA dehydrogenase
MTDPLAAFRLDGDVAVVTGGASGIGRAIVLALAREGARVAILDLNGDGAAAVAGEIGAAGGEAHAWRLDISDAARVDAVVGEVRARWGTVHVLVNCAGWDRPMPFVETTPEFWDRILAVNLKGPMACTRAALRHMIKQGSGKIVSIASDAGRVGSTGEAVYSAAKGGLIALTKTVAREVARHRINVNCVCPGPSDTPLFQQEFAAASPKLAESLKRVIPWGRLGVPDDVAPAVVFLASDEAGFITGQTLSVSGGLTMI